jgi:hypothetical protein
MRLVRSAFLVALFALIAGSAYASTTAPIGASPLALQTIDYSPMVAAIVPANSSTAPNASWVPAEQQQQSEYRRRPYDDDPYRNHAVRYRERGSRSRNSSSSPAQIHFGFFDPDGHGATSILLGLRGGPLVDPHVQIGGGVDWIYRTDDETVVAGEPFSQGGTTVTPTRVLSRASTNLFPFTLFMQVSGDENQSIIPYGGIGGGWEVLFLSADDFTTGQSFDGTFTGWGWQAWLGAGIPLSGQARLNGEVYVNQSDPERDVDDPATGLTFRERIDADGVGMRLGLQFGF